jgi:putative phosphoesterase
VRDLHIIRFTDRRPTGATRGDVVQNRDAWPGNLHTDTTRVAVVSDTHEQGDGWGSPPELIQALQGAELILHCGDLDSLGVLDHLETIAPVRAVRGYPDAREDGDRLAEVTRIVEVAGVRIGMVHDPAWPSPPAQFTHTLEFPPGDVRELMARKFGEPVDMVCFGDTHEEFVGWYQGMLFVNPGSPTRPGIRHARGDLGTFAVLDIKNGVVSVEIKKLQRVSQFTESPQT